MEIWSVILHFWLNKMLLLVTYDVSVTTPKGKNRLRMISKICSNFGVRVQNSVFECEVDPAQFVQLKSMLLSSYDPKEDSLRFYHLGSKGKQKVVHYGVKHVADPLRDPIII